VQTRRKGALSRSPRATCRATCLPCMGVGVGFVDSASEKTKARTVVEIYLEPGVIPIPGLHPSDTTKTFILFATPMQAVVPQRTAQPAVAAGAAAAAATATAAATARWWNSPRSAVSGGGGGCGMSAVAASRGGGGGCGMSGVAASRGGGGGAMGDEAGHPSWFTE